mgnify:CR=1 FL=1
MLKLRLTHFVNRNGNWPTTYLTILNILLSFINGLYQHCDRLAAIGALPLKTGYCLH